jgi:hypothetical protein
MIGEGLFVFLPTIIAITISFFVGVAIGIFMISLCVIGCGFAILKIPHVKPFVLSWLEKN